MERQHRLRAIIEYPVKTMNTNRERNMYQVDTGPVAFPDLACSYPRHVDGVSLAFVAFNADHFADFIIEVPTSSRAPEAAEQPACDVYHYSKRVSLPARNRLHAVTG